jgi:FlgD Ig-like domain
MLVRSSGHAFVRLVASTGLWLCLLAGASAAAGPYSRLQVLLPGESPAPGTGSGKTGTPRAQVVGVPFDVTVRACDNTWNLVNTVTNAIQILSNNGTATLPPNAQLVAGQRVFTVKFNAGGTFNVFAHDLTDATIPDGASAAVASLVLDSFEFSGISQKHQNAGQPQNLTIWARNPSGQTVTGFNGTVRVKELTSFGDGRTSPETITFVNGVWSGGITCFRADETNINRGNVNIYVWLESAPAIDGTSNPFLVHPGSYTRVQIVTPGETQLPGSLSGLLGAPSSQSAGHSFPVSVYSTDTWWNVVGGSGSVTVSSSDPAANLPQSGALSNGVHTFNVTLNTVGSRTLSASASGKTGMTSAPIQVLPSSANGFAISTITSPQTAGVPVAVTVRATDGSGNTVPNYNGDAILTANTGAGSITPQMITFTSGVWTGPVTFFGAGGAVTLNVADFSSPPHTGLSNSFSVQPGPFAGLQVLLPGETPRGGTSDGREGIPTTQQAGTPFTLTLRAVDQYWNLVSGVNDRVSLGSTDAFAGMPAETTLANGQRLFPIRLFRTGPQRVWAADVDNPAMHPDTSTAVNVTGGPFAKVLILAPGESPAPGTATGRTGTATDQSINYAFTVTTLATDAWWNPVGGVTDVVHITSDDPLATLPPNQAMVDGRADLTMRLARGGYNQILVSDVTNPSRTGSSTQVRAISSGFHLEAAVSPASAAAGAPFTLTVKVTNDAGSVIQEINSFVTVEVQNASSRNPGHGTLLTTQFQLLQGQRSVSETYTFAEPILIVARDDAGNAPATSNVIDIVPGPPDAIHLTSSPTWVGGNKHATLSAALVDAYNNGVADRPMVFSRLSGTGTLTPIDSLTDATGIARADFLSGRQPETDKIRASCAGLIADYDLVTAFVDPNAPGGTITNYPNPFHPPTEPTTIAYQLDDDATVRARVFTQSGDLVLDRRFERGTTGGQAGLNEFVWDGKNGKGEVVSSGGYVLLIEAQGQGETLHVMRRKLALVR